MPYLDTGSRQHQRVTFGRLLSSRIALLRGPFGWFGTAAFFGVLFHLVIFVPFLSNNQYFASISRFPSSQLPDWRNGSTTNLDSRCQTRTVDREVAVTVTEHMTAPTLPALFGPSPWGNGHGMEMPLEDIRVMISTTKGFYARDYSLGLGWNNVSLSLWSALP